ncbi:selenide, water dikinase SelD [Chondromyces crocatus]|uniref:Selenide, water dikinase n=1 Tax=Chondromyces crocatus TaxID=52 RepID=A0A0K1ENI8_CHOCO|nr:selenide, water dikinase SelD [Chondromyces crocatus]AKT42158.1 selenophosphate synthase [Chondromyces crocatus]
MSIPRLTSLVQGGGCARKLPAESLVQVLRGIPSFAHPWTDARPGPFDDAAVVQPEGAARSMVLTIDIVTPIVDDPRVFGAIAATNAMSDVWAMGGRPEVALAFAGVPTDKLPLEVLREMMVGLQEACARARCGIVGGHTLADAEPKCGLAVVGSVDPAQVWSHRSAQAGDALILTKALGTGIVSQAIRAERADEGLVARATAQMLMLNEGACEVGLSVGAHSCTDVTGFGLLGHLRNVVEASGLGATIHAGEVPLLEGVLALAEEGLVPGGSKRNLAYASEVTGFEEGVGGAVRALLADAQTSGGLLLCVPEARAEEAVRQLRGVGCERAAWIGRLTAGDAAGEGGKRIEVRR